jgi:ketosteroid isomerase-like protein
MDKAQLAEQMLHSIGKDMGFFWDNAHPDLVLEFPYAPWVGLPERVAGRDDAEPYLDDVGRMFPGLTFHDVRVMPLAEPDSFVLEYNGSCPAVNNYSQRYINIMRFEGDKLALFREYWNTTEATRALGGAGA